MPENNPRKLTPKDWEALLRKANIQIDDLDKCKSAKSRAIKIGLFLSRNVGRTIPIDVNGRAGQAILRVEKGRAKERRYYFEVTWDHEPEVETTAPIIVDATCQTTGPVVPSHVTEHRPPTAEKETQLGRGQEIRGGNNEQW